ncbi:hypothetical protein ElyMa_001134800 [Elysia marginata]|uniref:Secreted protein n=1 Tax=Elysia marginata TaxID=1093978 RepID=A0AAV4HY52_9GAST|nr:hypothetical protein ElyMa_001134800 [Elysia marginata]
MIRMVVVVVMMIMMMMMIVVVVVVKVRTGLGPNNDEKIAVTRRKANRPIKCSKNNITYRLAIVTATVKYDFPKLLIATGECQDLQLLARVV